MPPIPPWELPDRELTPTGSEQQLFDSLRTSQVGKKNFVPSAKLDGVNTRKLNGGVGVKCNEEEEDDEDR